MDVQPAESPTLYIAPSDIITIFIIVNNRTTLFVWTKDIGRF